MISDRELDATTQRLIATSRTRAEMDADPRVCATNSITLVSGVVISVTESMTMLHYGPNIIIVPNAELLRVIEFMQRALTSADTR